MPARIIKFFPLSAALLMPFTFLVTYGWSVGLGHVEPNFPYISATGANHPESTFFSFMLNIIALLMLLTVWARHRQITDHCGHTTPGHRLHKASRVASVFGYAAALGICLVGNFQATAVISVHLIGAAMAFGLGNVYLWIQSCMSVALQPVVNSRATTAVRFLCSAVASLMILTTVLFSFLHDYSNPGVAYWTRDQRWWRGENRKNWAYHVVATSSEWVLAAMFVVVLLTLVPEFKRMTFQGVRVEYNQDRGQVAEVNFAESTQTVDSIRL